MFSRRYKWARHNGWYLFLPLYSSFFRTCAGWIKWHCENRRYNCNVTAMQWVFCSAYSGKWGGQSSLHADPVRMLKFTSQLRYLGNSFYPWGTVIGMTTWDWQVTGGDSVLDGILKKRRETFGVHSSNVLYMYLVDKNLPSVVRRSLD